MRCCCSFRWYKKNPTAPDIIMRAAPRATPVFTLSQLLGGFEGGLEAKGDEANGDEIKGVEAKRDSAVTVDVAI